MIAHNESVTSTVNYASQRIVILGAGPGGYEAALVAASSNADVTIIERNALGGSAVLTDVVPSKTLIATADMMTRFSDAGRLGIENTKGKAPQLQVDMNRVNSRVLDLAHQQSADIKRALASAGVKIISGTGKLTGPHTVAVTDNTGLEYDLHADFILLSVGTHPREMATGQPDGERILTWTQLYNLREVPHELIVIGSGVTGAEFASAYNGLGSQVTLISSRDRVLPGEDEDAARVLEDVFERRGCRCCFTYVSTAYLRCWRLHGCVPVGFRSRYARAHRDGASFGRYGASASHRSSGSEYFHHPRDCDRGY